jgi:hypothetical protein
MLFLVKNFELRGCSPNFTEQISKKKKISQPREGERESPVSSA